MVRLDSISSQPLSFRMIFLHAFLCFLMFSLAFTIVVTAFLLGSFRIEETIDHIQSPSNTRNYCCHMRNNFYMRHNVLLMVRMGLRGTLARIRNRLLLRFGLYR